MPTIADITSWTPPEILQAVRELLPKGWSCTFDFDGMFVGSIQNEEGRVVWDDSSGDERLILLNGYGYLFTLGASTATHPVWNVRRRELTREEVQRRALEFPDPDDLDPDFLERAYSKKGGGS